MGVSIGVPRDLIVLIAIFLAVINVLEWTARFPGDFLVIRDDRLATVYVAVRLGTDGPSRDDTLAIAHWISVLHRRGRRYNEVAGCARCSLLLARTIVKWLEGITLVDTLDGRLSSLIEHLSYLEKINARYKMERIGKTTSGVERNFRRNGKRVEPFCQRKLFCVPLKIGRNGSVVRFEVPF